VLVVDDDRVFGAFMMAALQSRGHDSDWAATMADGVASLYSQRYDLVIVDLRLPDGSGLDFLREAADEGLLTSSAAIILTGHDFEEPDDIRVYHKPIDVDSFLERVDQIVAVTKRRRSGGRLRPPAVHRGASNDGSRSARQVKIDLVLYMSAESDKSIRAIKAIRAVLSQYRTDQINFRIFDLSAAGSEAPDDPVVFTPTLVKRGPGPRTWIVGNLDQPDLLADLLEVHGVDRKPESKNR
jgi:CheY-like chemotaxis protein